MPPLSPSAALRLPSVTRWLEVLRPKSVVEAGCGMGSMACRLAESFDYRGYEPDASSFEVVKARLEGLGHGDVINGIVPEAPDRHFDLLVAFEVLEHIDDDLAALRDWAGWVAPGGHVLLSVPANPDRFGPCDELVGHFRRYSRRSLVDVMLRAGLTEVVIEAWGMPAGFLLQWVRNARATRHSGHDEVGTAGSGRLNQPSDRFGTIVQLLSRPVAALQAPFRGTDFGIGYIAVGRVPGGS